MGFFFSTTILADECQNHSQLTGSTETGADGFGAQDCCVNPGTATTRSFASGDRPEQEPGPEEREAEASERGRLAGAPPLGGPCAQASQAPRPAPSGLPVATLGSAPSLSVSSNHPFQQNTG